MATAQDITGSFRISDYKKGALIGSGGHGKVFIFTHKDNDSEIAVKKIDICFNRSSTSNEQQDTAALRDLMNEVKLMCKLCPHAHVVQYLSHFMDTEEQTFYIAMELMKRCLKGLIEEKGALSEEQTGKYTYQILLGVQHLHKNHVVHRDLKSGNVLLDSNDQVKLSDFGVSKQLATLFTSRGATTHDKGTANFMSPEAVKGYSGEGDDNNKTFGYGMKTDIWSTGCTVIEMITGKPPFSECQNQFQVLYKIGLHKTPTLPEGVSEDATDFLKRTFKIDPSERPTASKLLDHPFVRRHSARPFLPPPGPEVQKSRFIKVMRDPSPSHSSTTEMDEALADHSYPVISTTTISTQTNHEILLWGLTTPDQAVTYIDDRELLSDEEENLSEIDFNDLISSSGYMTYGVSSSSESSSEVLCKDEAVQTEPMTMTSFFQCKRGDPIPQNAVEGCLSDNLPHFFARAVIPEDGIQVPGKVCPCPDDPNKLSSACLSFNGKLLESNDFEVLTSTAAVSYASRKKGDCLPEGAIEAGFRHGRYWHARGQKDGHTLLGKVGETAPNSCILRAADISFAGREHGIDNFEIPTFL